MAFKSKAGKSYGNKFKASRADRESAVQDGMESTKGPRSQANAIEGGASDTGGPVNAQAGATMPAKAKEVHITHDDNAGHHHVHTVMDNGQEEHTDHQSREEAHFHGAKSAGAEGADAPSGEDPGFPKKRKQPMAEAPDADDYDVEPLE
jgi:hypothetical protein